MIYRYHHLHLICSNLERMITFFTEILGAKLNERRKFTGVDGASLDLNGTMINLRVSREDDFIKGDSSQKCYGYDHLALEVEDLDASYQELKGKGVTFTVPPQHSGKRRNAFFNGPDNISIELLQPLH
jgi:catechol 2,3-dioxygenase-like lactoylglutathione lyase family enzyme